MATLKINSGDLAFTKEPALAGLEESREKIWSKNTGRSTDGTMTGDIIATKLKLRVKYAYLTEAEKVALQKAIDPAFFKVTYGGETYTMYASSPTYPVYDTVNGARYIGVGVELIEK